jgi:hypothetical protein
MGLGDPRSTALKPNTAGGGLARVTTLQPAVGNGQLAYPHPAIPERRVLIVATPAALGQRDGHQAHGALGYKETARLVLLKKDLDRGA